MPAQAFRLVKNDRIQAGDYVVGRGSDQRTYVAGDIVVSDSDLIAQHPGKFEQAPVGSKDKYDGKAQKKAQRPVTGLPSRNTPRPVGPEETPNSPSEIEEVRQAIESGEHEVLQRVDDEELDTSRDRPKAKKMSPAPIKKTGKPVARRLDPDDDDDEDEEDDDETPVVKKGKKVKAAAEDDEEEDDEIEEEEADDDEEDDEEEEEAPPVKKKPKVVPVKKKKSKK